jgi:hypothetical protein
MTQRRQGNNFPLHSPRMRIIAGEFRGRRLLPPSELTKPGRSPTASSNRSSTSSRPNHPRCAMVYDCLRRHRQPRPGIAQPRSFERPDLLRGRPLRRRHPAPQYRRSLKVDSSNAAASSQPIFSPGQSLPRPVPVSPLSRPPLPPSGKERPTDLQRLAKTLAAERHLAPGAIVVFRHAITPTPWTWPRFAAIRSANAVTARWLIDLLTCPSIPTNTSPRPTQRG